MPKRTIETDYLVVGCGAAGMAFADSLLAVSDADIVMVDRRHAPGGHWNDAYPFVRLNQPAAYYGVNSMPLGSETIDTSGTNAGMYERAGGTEICAYYDRVMQKHLLASGRVRYFPMTEFVGENRFVSRVSGEEHEVKVRKKIVDARYLEPGVPSTSSPPFEVASGVRCVPPNDLVRVAERADGYVIIGGGKTALDACLWLLGIGVPPSDIRWVKPREQLYLNLGFLQGGDLIATLFRGVSLHMEAAAQATSLDDLVKRALAVDLLLCVDSRVETPMFRSSSVDVGEIEQVRRIDDVVRLGRVRRLDADAIVLEHGSVRTTTKHLHVHCSANGLNTAPNVPIFARDRITLQSMRSGLIPFNSALIAYVEATRGDIEEKNRLCPPSRQPDTTLDWVRGTVNGMKADRRWAKEPDIAEWLENARLNPARGLKKRMGEPAVQEAMQRFLANVRPGLAKLEQLIANEPPR